VNEERRKKLEALNRQISQISAELETIRDDEVEANENKPEALQDSSVGVALDEACDALRTAEDAVDDALGS
jgi:phage shock protein A